MFLACAFLSACGRQACPHTTCILVLDPPLCLVFAVTALALVLTQRETIIKNRWRGIITISALGC